MIAFASLHNAGAVQAFRRHIIPAVIVTIIVWGSPFQYSYPRVLSACRLWVLHTIDECVISTGEGSHNTGDFGIKRPYIRNGFRSGDRKLPPAGPLLPDYAHSDS